MSGPRRLDVLRDLPGMVELLHLVFGRELRPAGYSLAADLFLARFTAPLVWLFSLSSERFHEHFLGYVWEEDGRLVGNVSLARAAGHPLCWTLGNVAVHPAYRRRGIARRLIQMAVEYCQRQGAEVVTLEVRHDNTPAYNLYLNLGFYRADSVTKLRLEGLPLVNAAPLSGYSVRPLPLTEWHRARALSRLAAPPGVAGMSISRPDGERPGFLRWLSTAVSGYFTGRPVYRWAMEKRGMLVAFLEITPSSRPAAYRLRLVAHPGFRGAVEENLVAWALSRLQPTARASVLAEVRTDDVAQLAALRCYGFKETEVMDTLALLVSGMESSAREPHSSPFDS